MLLKDLPVGPHEPDSVPWIDCGQRIEECSIRPRPEHGRRSPRAGASVEPIPSLGTPASAREILYAARAEGGSRYDCLGRRHLALRLPVTQARAVSSALPIGPHSRWPSKNRWVSGLLRAAVQVSDSQPYAPRRQRRLCSRCGWKLHSAHFRDQSFPAIWKRLSPLLRSDAGEVDQHPEGWPMAIQDRRWFVVLRLPAPSEDRRTDLLAGAGLRSADRRSALRRPPAGRVSQRE